MLINTVYQTLGIMHLETTLMASRITGIVLIDATGRRYEVSMDFAKSYEVCIQIPLSDLETLKI